ncbi:MAG: diphthamide biosynthesis enzyme Dph2 [Sulfolobales archaeon]
MNELEKYYTYDLDKIVREVRSINARKVLIQLPDGFKHYSIKLLEELTNTLRDVEFVVDANPTYGSCILNTNLISQYDLTIHFGHEPYPYGYDAEIPRKVLFADFLSTLTLNKELINRLITLLKSLNINKVAIYTVHQHKKNLGRLKEELRDASIKILNNLDNAVVMGCWFNDVLRHVDVADGYVVVAGGLFHPLGVGIVTKGLKHVVQVDPYRGEVRLLDDVVWKYLRIRYSKVMEASNAATWCLVHGVEGQFRSRVREELINALRARGLKYFEYRSSTINQETLRNIDSKDVEAYVITACPRIPIDDLQDFEKPVLTPGEAFMILKSISDYIFPW